MGWIKKLFGISEQKPRTMLDEALDALIKYMIFQYRHMAFVQGGAPTEKTSDQKIAIIYKKVYKVFIEASAQRGERLTMEIINAIVWKFLQVNEMFGAEMMNEHLDYEIQKYLHEGLRPDYKKMSESDFFKLPSLKDL